MALLAQLSLYRRLMRQRYKMDARDLAAYQERELLKFVESARQRSPFYRELYGTLRIETLEDFYRLPRINKSIMMTNFDRLNTEGLVLKDLLAWALEKEQKRDYLGYFRGPQGEYVVGLSSGTSGNKGVYVTPRELTRQVPAVFLARGGIGLSDLPLRILFLLRVFSQGFADINAPMLKLNYKSTMTPVLELLQFIKDARINFLMAPPSMVRQLLPYAGQLRHFKKIMCYAEVLEKEEKARFEQHFGTQVIEIYQASEGQLASACRHGRLHINEDLVFVELRDEQGRLIDRPGVVGNTMLITNLVNYAQPLIRYEMNDLMVLGEPCSCGSAFRTVDRILGRNDEVLYLPAMESVDSGFEAGSLDSKKGGLGSTTGASKRGLRPVFPDLVSRWIIRTSDNIREFFVEQTQADRLVITIDLIRPCDEQAICSKLIRTCTEELASYGIQAHIETRLQAIELPKDRSKLRRFKALPLQ